MTLAVLVSDVADALFQIDATRACFRDFQPGVGPFGEPQLVKVLAAQLNLLPTYAGSAQTKRSPDLLIRDKWAIEIKITRPFGDNGREAEDWSVNLLHPYPGNTSSIGDCYKLLKYQGSERRVVMVIGYEHNPPKIDLTCLIDSFQAIAANVLKIRLSDAVHQRRAGLVHPTHQALRVYAWEVFEGRTSS
jgi:hypothetical protein